MDRQETPDRRGTRIEKLRALVARDGALRLATAAAALEVSSMTLRRDLADGGSGLDLLGGHVVLRQNGLVSAYALDVEENSHAQAKADAGRHAAVLVSSGDTIFVDCGTTTPHMIAALPAEIEITVVCYALNVAAAVAARLRRAQLFLLGGLFHPASETFLSEDALRALKRLGINKAFMSAGGLHEERGASCSNFNEVPVKQAILQRAMQAFLVIDQSKLGQVKPAHFAERLAFERIVTDMVSMNRA